AVSRRVEGILDAVDLEAVGLVLADTVLENARRGAVDRVRLVAEVAVVDVAAAVLLAVAHRVGVAPAELDAVRLPEAEGVTVEEVRLAFLHEHVPRVLDG